MEKQHVSLAAVWSSPLLDADAAKLIVDGILPACDESDHAT